MRLFDPDIESVGCMAADSLDPGFRLMLETRAVFHPGKTASQLEADLIATAFFETGDGVPMRADALDRVTQRLDEVERQTAKAELPDYLQELPDGLRYEAARALENGGWQSRGPGMRTLPLRPHGSTLEQNGGSLVLFESEPGFSFGRHRHIGEEYLLILKGTLREESGLPMPAGSLLFSGAGSCHDPRGGADGVCAILAILTGGLELLSRGTSDTGVFA